MRIKNIKLKINSITKDFLSIIYKKKILKTKKFNKKEFEDYQYKAFKEILFISIEKIPYYKEKEDYIKALERFEGELSKDLNKLPVLKKSIVKEKNEKFWMENSLTSHFHTTSGTSGTPLKIKSTLFEKVKSRAILNEWYKDLGYEKGWKLFLSGFFTPRGKDGEIYYIDNTNKEIYLSIYSINESNAQRIFDLISEKRVNFVYGYASAVYQLAMIINKSKKRVFNNSVICISTSEVLYDNWKKVIEREIGNVYNLYGSQEGSHMVLECSHNSLHINPLIGIVEILDEENKEVAEGEIGKVVITGLNKKSMPLIRYEIGDYAQKGNFDKCRCGLEWPTISNIEGRAEDLVKTTDGRRIGYLCFHATKNLDGILEAQLVQENYNEFKMNLVLIGNRDKESIEQNISSELKKRLLEEVDIKFYYTDKIKRGPNGKFKAVVVEDF